MGQGGSLRETHRGKKRRLIIIAFLTLMISTLLTAALLADNTDQLSTQLAEHAGKGLTGIHEHKPPLNSSEPRSPSLAAEASEAPLIVPSQGITPALVTQPETQPTSAKNSVTDTIPAPILELAATELEPAIEADPAEAISLADDNNRPADKITSLTDTLSSEQIGVSDTIAAAPPPGTLPVTGRIPAPRTWLFLLIFILFLLGNGLAAVESKYPHID